MQQTLLKILDQLRYQVHFTPLKVLLPIDFRALDAVILRYLPGPVVRRDQITRIEEIPDGLVRYAMRHELGDLGEIRIWKEEEHYTTMFVTRPPKPPPRHPTEDEIVWLQFWAEEARKHPTAPGSPGTPAGPDGVSERISDDQRKQYIQILNTQAEALSWFLAGWHESRYGVEVAKLALNGALPKTPPEAEQPLPQANDSKDVVEPSKPTRPRKPGHGSGREKFFE